MYFMCVPPSVGRTAGAGIDTRRKLSLVAHALDASAAVDAVYRSDWGRIVATLIRLVRDFDVAEEAAQEAFTAAVDQWRGSRAPPGPPAPGLQTAPATATRPRPPPARLAGQLDALPPPP